MADVIAMFITMGWTTQNAPMLVNDKGIDDFDELAKIDLRRATIICKVLRTGTGGNQGLAVSEKAEHHLSVSGLLSKQALCTSRTLEPADINVADPYQFKGAIAQYEIEKEWDNAPGIASFKPIKEALLKKGWPCIRNLLIEKARAVL